MPGHADPSPLGQLASLHNSFTVSALAGPCLAAGAQPPASCYCPQAGPAREAHRTPVPSSD